MEEWKIRFAGAIVRAVAQNLREDVGGAKNFGAVGENLRALGGIVGIGITGFDARARFERDLESGFRQRGQHRGYQRNAPLPRKRFAGHTNNHDASSTEVGSDDVCVKVWSKDKAMDDRSATEPPCACTQGKYSPKEYMESAQMSASCVRITLAILEQLDSFQISECCRLVQQFARKKP